jgi:hypothetical protein
LTNIATQLAMHAATQQRLCTQVAAVLVVADAGVRAALQQELPVICLLAKLDPEKV